MKKLVQDPRLTILDFYETVKDKYPVSQRQMLEICRKPFKFFRQALKWEQIPTIRIKYIGEISIKPFTAVTEIRKLKYFLEHPKEGQDDEEIKWQINRLEEYLTRHPYEPRYHNQDTVYHTEQNREHNNNDYESKDHMEEH